LTAVPEIVAKMSLSVHPSVQIDWKPLGFALAELPVVILMIAVDIERDVHSVENERDLVLGPLVASWASALAEDIQMRILTLVGDDVSLDYRFDLAYSPILLSPLQN
jgi:hypothetical protein